MAPVSKARNSWPPVRLSELPNKISALILGEIIFGNLAVDSKFDDNIVPMQVTASHYCAGREVFHTSPL